MLISLVLVFAVVGFTAGCESEPEYGILTYEEKDLGGGAKLLGSRYEGEILHRKPHGQGIWILSDGTRYEGQWHNGELNGWVTLTYIEGDRWEGMFDNGHPVGPLRKVE